MQKYKTQSPVSISLVALSGIAFGLCAGEILSKNGHESMLVRLALILFGALGATIAWKLYSRLVGGIFKIPRGVVENADAWSYAPFMLTALMIARHHWPLPRLGLWLIGSATLMTIWIKAGQWIAYSRGATDARSLTFAAPLGFAAALLVQMAWPAPNIARYLVMGQIASVVFWLFFKLIFPSQKCQSKKALTNPK